MYTLYPLRILVNTEFLRNSTPVHRGRRLKNVFCLEDFRVKEDFGSEVAKGIFGSWGLLLPLLGWTAWWNKT